MRGKISYVRGHDPRNFPTRIDHGIKIYDDLPDHKVWPCYLIGRQLVSYIDAFMKECVPNADAGQRNDLWKTTKEIARGLTPSGMGKWIKENWIPTPRFDFDFLKFVFHLFKSS